MDLSALITRLQTVGSLTQVLDAQTGGYLTPVASAAELYSRLSTITVGSDPVTVRALSQKDQAVFPSIVHQLVGSQVGIVDGYQVTQTDRYVLTARTTNYDELLTLVGLINTQLSGSSFDIEIEDMLHDWEDEKEVARADIQISFTYLATAAQTLPAAFVYAINRAASDTVHDNFVLQRVENFYGIILVTNTGNLQTLMDDVQSSLLGWQKAAQDDAFEYVGGSNLEGVAGLEVWREQYKDADFIQES